MLQQMLATQPEHSTGLVLMERQRWPNCWRKGIDDAELLVYGEMPGLPTSRQAGRVCLTLPWLAQRGRAKMGSPCRRPQAWQMPCLGEPLSNILELPMDSKADIQLVQQHENPMDARSSIRNGQLTVCWDRPSALLPINRWLDHL
jgi:hypothetical protein